MSYGGNVKKLIFISTTLFLTACGSNPNKVVAVKAGDDYYKPDKAAAMALDQDSNERIICKSRAVTGSHRKVKTCTTRAEMERDREDARKVMDENHSLNSRKLAGSKSGG
jgi:hypothetical protein